MHYDNPIRARHEITYAVGMGVRSYSVDSHSELRKLIELVPAKGIEIAVRFKLPVCGASYNFGAPVEKTVALLQEVTAAGFVTALTFHPGTQCTDPMAWDAYLRAAAGICRVSGVSARRLNVGGGFPSHRRQAERPQLDAIFALIGRVAQEAFEGNPPALVCEPWRGAPCDHVVFGPTCDSVDRLPGDLPPSDDMEEGDYLIFAGMGAYSTATNTRFNGFGDLSIATVMSLAQ